MAMGIISVVVGALALCAAVLVLALGAWKGSPLRKRRQQLADTLHLTEQDERASKQQSAPWGNTGGSMGDVDSNDVDQMIRRGLDLIEKYSVAPDVQTLEKLIAGRQQTAPSSLLGVARLLGGLGGSTSSMPAASSVGAPIGESDEWGVAATRETGSDQ